MITVPSSKYQVSLLTLHLPIIEFKQICALDTDYNGTFGRQNHFTDFSHLRLVNVNTDANNSN
jgi:hypothetical protein